MSFFSLQGLGNSMLNFPALVSLRRRFNVRVVCYENGSGSFFRSFHPDVHALKWKYELLPVARGQNTDISYVSYPTWKKEMAAALLSPAPIKHLLWPVSSKMAPFIWRKNFSGDAELHDLENNIWLAQQILGEDRVDLDMTDAFGLRGQAPPTERVLAIHPTASAVCKYYPLPFWRDLLTRLQGEYDRLDVFCGSLPAEVAFSHAILESLPPAWRARARLHAGLKFSEVVPLLNQAAQFIGSDSSLMHLASLLDRPTLGLWSFANFRVIYPYGNSSKVYIPAETLQDIRREYTDEPPAYVARASADSVVRILRGEQRRSFAIQPLYKKSVQFFTY